MRAAVAILVLATPDDIVSWIRSGRPDLQLNAALLAAFVVVILIWIAAPREATSEDG